MELERPVTRGQQERPITRWRREDRPMTKDSVANNYSDIAEHPKNRGEERPVSRRGMLSRQSPVMEERPYTQQNSMRPMTASRNVAMRPPSATAFAARNVAAPGTASRLATAMLQQPVNRISTAMSLTGAQVSVVDRPITQQGLSGLRTGTRGPQMRQVQDKRYFEGLLQMKIRDLSQEITRLSREIDSQSREQSTFLVYDKRVKEMAAELTELQGQLADYNLVVDKVNTDTERSDVDAECSELKVQNDQTMTQLEHLFSQRQQREAQINQLEKEIEQEQHMTDNLLAAMSPPLREHYRELQQGNNQLQQQMETLQQELDALTNKKTDLDDQLSLSQVKQETVRLHHKLKEAEEKRESLLEEEKTRSTPAQEREQLLQRVKDDNAEMATMERQIGEIHDLIRKKRDELDQIEQDLDESQSERHQKYRELRRREETMEQFLSTFDESRDQEMARITELESSIVTALQQMSRNLAHSGHLPSVDDFATMKDNLAFKEGELEKSRKTVEGLSKEQQQLQQNLQKVEALEEKIKVEMETLRKRMDNMQSEMGTLSDLDSLRDHAQEKRTMLDEESKVLVQLKGPAQLALLEAEMKHENLQKRLNENETYAQLSNLERKLAQLEQNNFAIQEFIASKKSETDYEPLKEKVYKLTQDYNTTVKENIRKGGMV
ncbi:intraflagellar transport protein 74 homolog isoform X1 [Periplaneta americana]|uniref:intraflagellar transport protein 74 homolog isoform X1 n=2 Tax=Periplaneta americana TaxID=6978 RepID=UPI0037E8EC84